MLVIVESIHFVSLQEAPPLSLKQQDAFHFIPPEVVLHLFVLGGEEYWHVAF